MIRKPTFCLLVLVLLMTACGGSGPTGAPTSSLPWEATATHAIPQASATIEPMATAALVVTEESAAPDRLRTLASLRRISDFPFYEMHYSGDYGFSSFSHEGLEIEERAPSHLGGVSHQWACTCFAALSDRSDLIFGRNFDWHVHPALILFTNPSGGYASVSMVDLSYLGYGAEEPSWAEREALLDAPYFSFDGLNEHGVAVGIMAVDYADGGEDPDKVTIGSLHAVRLVLDYARDVEEAISLLQEYNVDFGGGPPLHYLVADSSGKSAVVEFIDGEVNAIRNGEPWQVATNFVIYDTSAETRGSLCSRYRRAHEALERADGSISPEEAMAVLEDVSQSGALPTIWSAVYNMTNGDIEIVVGRQYHEVHRFKLEMRRE